VGGGGVVVVVHIVVQVKGGGTEECSDFCSWQVGQQQQRGRLHNFRLHFARCCWRLLLLLVRVVVVLVVAVVVVVVCTCDQVKEHALLKLEFWRRKSKKKTKPKIKNAQKIHKRNIQNRNNHKLNYITGLIQVRLGF